MTPDELSEYTPREHRAYTAGFTAACRSIADSTLGMAAHLGVDLDESQWRDRPPEQAVCGLLVRCQELLHLRAAAALCACDAAFWCEDHESGKPRLSLLCSDVFGYACADAETIELSDAPALLDLHRREGWPGLVRWIAARRGCEPLPAVQAKMKTCDEARQEPAQP